MALERVRPFIYQLRDGSESDPYIDKTETIAPVSGRVVIEEIPVKGFGVLINGYVEKSSNTPTGKEFYVDYSNGVIYFDKSVTSNITVRYRGRGVVKVPAERIFYGDSATGKTMDITLKAMHDLLNDSKSATVDLQNRINAVILATSSANTAAQNADEKASLAQIATNLANTATTNANTAAQNANNEASNLSQMKSSVITATESANTAATNANTKAELADQKAILASQATDAANQAAAIANDKAVLADEAAINANSEGNIARTRGEFADSMAQEAQTQGLYAKTQGDFAKSEATDLQTLKDTLSLATSNANTATANANTASANADTSAINANEKATLAQTKIDAMNTLSTEVTTLKGTLQTKITESNTATSEAIVATGDANLAAQYANEKGLFAQTEASNLEQMKTDVSTATIQANGAASNAQIKANLADEKAIYAQQQGDYAKTQGDAIQDILDNGNVASVNGQTGAVVLGASDVGTLTTQQINDKIRADLDALVGASPETLNTLEELAQALGDDPNFATTITNELGTKANQSDLNTHSSDTGKHLQTGERDSWNAKLDASDVGVPGGVAELGVDGKVIPAQLPDIASSWNDLQDKPTEFNPTPHVHNVSEVTGLQEALDSAAKMEKYETVINATQGQSVVQIPWVTFDAVNDYLSVHINRTVLTQEDFSLVGRNMTLTEPLNENDSIHIVVLKAVVRGVDEPISAANLADGSITNDKLSTNNKVGNLPDLLTDNKTSTVGAVNELVGDVAGLSSQVGVVETNIGNRTSLSTTDKSNLVNAVNEVASKASSADTKATNATNQIGILSGLNTTAKDNLVNAVNELFTFANDGKTRWSNVIGSPLVSTDTFLQMQTKTQTIKNTLATNLTAMGQTAAGTETLTALVNKVSISYSAGTSVAYTVGNANSATTSSSSMVPYPDSNVNINFTGTARVEFRLGSSGTNAAFAQIYKNGSPFGTLRTTPAGSNNIVFTEDISVSNGDYIQVFFRTQTTSGSASAGNFFVKLNIVGAVTKR